MTVQAFQAREAFGARLRALRLDAGYSTARALARALQWPESKVSRLELGRRSPSEADLRAWCELTGATDQLPELLALLRGNRELWVEYRKLLRAGLKRGQTSWAKFEADSSAIRWYEQFLIPGLLQTAAYARAVLALAHAELEVPDDIDQAVQARLERQQILYSGDRTLAFLIEEQALRTHVGDHVLAGQLDRLLAVMGLPRVSVGIIPADAVRHVLPEHSFVLFDAATRVETVSAEMTITQPHELAMYQRKFELLQRSAVYGSAARALITRCLPESPA